MSLGDYPRPSVTVDVIIFTLRAGDLQVLLIRRRNPPFQGMWAIPGGFVAIDESLEAAALHYLDNLDAQVNRFNLLLETARDKGVSWTDYDRLLGRMLYAGEQEGLTVEENSFTA